MTVLYEASLTKQMNFYSQFPIHHHNKLKLIIFNSFFNFNSDEQ